MTKCAKVSENRLKTGKRKFMGTKMEDERCEEAKVVAEELQKGRGKVQIWCKW